MRKKVFILGRPPYSEVRWFPWPGQTSPPEPLLLYPELHWDNFDDKSHFWLGEKELGMEFKRSPSELRDLFGWNGANLLKQSAGTIMGGIVRRSVVWLR